MCGGGILNKITRQINAYLRRVVNHFRPMKLAAVALLLVAASAASKVPDEYAVWPPPRDIHGSGSPLQLHPDFSIEHSQENGAPTSSRLQRAMNRYLARLRTSKLATQAVSGSTLKTVRIFVDSQDPHLGENMHTSLAKTDTSVFNRTDY